MKGQRVHSGVPPVQVVLFDLYETLITEFDPDWKPGNTLGDCFGVDRQDFADAWRATFVRRMSGDTPHFPSALHEIAKMLDCQFDDALVHRLCQKRVAEHRSLLRQIRDDIQSMLRCLCAAGVRLGLIGNASHEDVMTGEESPLHPFFDTAVFSYQVGLVKPDRRVYELTCARLDVAPENVLFCGDGGSDELFGAAAAGLVPCWATWFLSQYPGWETSSKGRRNADHFPHFDTPEQLVACVIGE